MGKQFQPRVLRSYRNKPPGRFHGFIQKVKTGLTEHAQSIPDSAWASNPTLLASFLAAADKHDALYHEAIYGSKLVIMERDLLQAQLIVYLDEIASILETVAVRNPEVLIASGFDLTKERRSSARAKSIQPFAAEVKVNAEQSV